MENDSTPRRKSIVESLVPAILVVTVGLAFCVGILWQKVQNIENGKTSVAGTQTQPTAAPNQTITPEVVKGLFDKEVIILGDKNSANLLVEAADPSCPYCHIAGGHNPEVAEQFGANFKYVSKGGSYVPAVPEMKKLVEEGKAAYAYIYTPGHGNGEMGMKALYCAHEKGKFWEVHDVLMTNAGFNLMENTIRNDKTKSQELVDFLKAAMNPTELKTCIDSGKYDERLANDTALVASLRPYGISGTPGFIINEQVFPGAFNWTDMQSFVK